jgi:hypothetical protein
MTRTSKHLVIFISLIYYTPGHIPAQQNSSFIYISEAELVLPNSTSNLRPEVSKPVSSFLGSLGASLQARGKNTISKPTCVAVSGDIPPLLGDIPETYCNRQLPADTRMLLLLQQRLVCEKPGYSVASMQILVKAKRTKPSLIE